jgi:hypothetical protein
LRAEEEAFEAVLQLSLAEWQGMELGMADNGAWGSVAKRF